MQCVVLLMLGIYVSISGTARARSVSTYELSKNVHNGTQKKQIMFACLEGESTGTRVEDRGQFSMRADTSLKLKRFRELMAQNNYQAYIIPTDDEHQSEYISNYDKRRQYVSGFTGTAGTAVVLVNDSDGAALWTDSRYFLQAQQELDSNWIMMKDFTPGTPSIPQWISSKLSSGSRVGTDSRLINHRRWLFWKHELVRSGMELVDEHFSLVDKIWTEAEGRPAKPNFPIFVHRLEFAGKRWEDKVEDVREKLKEEGVEGTIITALDNVAWLLNLRGNDIPYNPLFKGYIFVTEDIVRLYVQSHQVTLEVQDHLRTNGCNNKNCVQVLEYDHLAEDLRNFVQHVNKILVPEHVSYFIYNLIPEVKRIVGESPLISMKIVKNPTEIKGMINAHIREAVALADFLSLLEEQVKAGIPWDELKASATIAEFRGEQKLNRGDSFETISASGPNAAGPHYTPKPATNRPIDKDHMYMLDTGGQYLDGTTDITRTVHFGNPTDFEKEMYTRVLMGNINLAMLVFPDGVRDTDVDVLLRLHLYEIGLDYPHGSGHGVGSFLTIHEFPPRIEYYSSGYRGTKLKPGMFLTDEPSFYKEGSFGLRHENLLLVTEATTEHNFQKKNYYKFQTVSYVPFEPDMIKLELLNDKQLQWLNNYNTDIRRILGPALRQQGKSRALNWVIRKTFNLTRSC